MLNLLNAEFFKLRKSKSVYFGILTAAALALLLYGSLVMIDKINQGELSNGTGGVIVYQDGSQVDVAGSQGSMMEKIGVTGVLQQMFGGHFTGMILAVLVSIFVIQEFGSGSIKNLVGKGYSRRRIFLSKLLSVMVLAILFQAAVLAVSICLGIPFMGWETFSKTVWMDAALYAALQMIYGVTVAVIFLLVGELTRNLAAGIAVSIGVLLFSSTLTAGLDLVFHGLDIQLSNYWVLDLMSSCPVTDFETGFLVRSIVVSLAWLVIAAVLAAAHFQRADLK